MSEAVILEKLEQLTGEIRTMKAEIQGLKDELKDKQQPADPKDVVFEPVGEIDGEELKKVCASLLESVEELRGMSSTFRAGAELAEDLGPVVQQVYPKAIRFCNELEGDFEIDELVVLLRKTITSLDTIGEGVDMLRAGVELRDDLIPVVQLVYPKLLKALTALHEGEFRAERLGDLLHTVLLNIHTLSDLLNMLAPFTEFVKEFNVILQHTDILPNINKWLGEIQVGNPAIHLATKALSTIKKIDLNEERVTQLCDALSTINLTKVEPVSPLGMIGQLRDPKVQEALGFMFMLLHAVGGCLQAWERTGSSSAQANE